MAPRCAWHEAHVKRVRRRERTRLNHRQTHRLVTSEIVPAHKHNTGARLAWSWDYPIHLDLPSGSALNRCAHIRGAHTAHGDIQRSQTTSSGESDRSVWVMDTYHLELATQERRFVWPRSINPCIKINLKQPSVLGANKSNADM